ncbi:PAS domain S-box protein [Spirosoma sp. KCTC 42546]|uniref:PAS domain-containing sensor histidine kinase n=1 Tax=Spirosoma sp. KCTC 42546 TaxID=2520506 RepID=UPI0011598FE2|nr:PAS domain-containing sensor histidine kinase [Spirosoma sp. KCTC 42546]QDK80899.1 PAS domain S-box protein [Spirosoma sp. KCTC 42546]
MTDEQKPFDQDMAAELERLQFTLQAAGIGTWDLNSSTQLVRWNDRCQELFNFPGKDTLPFQQVLSRIHPDDQDRVNAAIQQALTAQSDGLYDVLFRTLGTDHTPSRWLNCKGKAYIDQAGVPQRLSGIAQDVTLQIQQQAHLATSEQFDQLANEAAGIGTFHLHLATGYLTYKALLAKILTGQETTRFDHTKLTSFIHPDDRSIRQKAFADGLLTGKIRYEVRFIWQDDSVHWIRMLGTYIFDESGNAQDVIGVVQDITDQVLSRQRLEDSEAQMRSLIESAPFPIGVYVGRQMQIQFANQSIKSVWGKGDEVVGKLYSQILPELANQNIYDQLDSVYSTGTPFHAKNQRVDITIDGKLQPYYFNYSFTPLYNAAGQVYGVMNTAAEITDLILAKQQVEKTEAALLGAIELAELATWSLDIETGIFSYSKRFMDWLGFSESTKSMDEAYNPLPDDYRQSVADAIAATVAPGSSGYYENEHPIINRLTGQIRIIHAQAQVFYDTDGKPLTLTGTAQDITTQRQLQLALEQQVQERTEELAATNEELSAINEELAATNEEYAATNEELEEANQLFSRSNENLQRFAYVASHDLQEPLRKVQQFGDLLKSQYASQLGDGIGYLERMQAAASRMSNLIKDLLSFSRISTRQEVSSLVSLNGVLSTVLSDLDLRIQETGALVTVDSLPRIHGDKSQLEQLFQNLLSNALKFRRTDRPPLVHVRAQLIATNELPLSIKPTRITSNYHRIDVSDNGIGFDEKYVDRIFQVFQRLHNKSEFAGTGIGLAICEKVVANHGGAITAHSKLGQGATFSLYFPI